MSSNNAAGHRQARHCLHIVEMTRELTQRNTTAYIDPTSMMPEQPVEWLGFVDVRTPCTVLLHTSVGTVGRLGSMGFLGH